MVFGSAGRGQSSQGLVGGSRKKEKGGVPLHPCALGCAD